MKTISIKELRTRLAEVADRVQNGEVFTVFRRSKPSFVLMQPNATDDCEWETVVDFTDEGAKDGETIEDVLQALKTAEEKQRK